MSINGIVNALVLLKSEAYPTISIPIVYATFPTLTIVTVESLSPTISSRKSGNQNKTP